MQKVLFFLATGTLCVIAAMSLFRLHLIEDQYAAVALSTNQPPANSEEVVAANTESEYTPVLFPLAPSQKTAPAEAAPTTTTQTIAPTTPAKTQSVVPTQEALTTIPVLTNVETLNTVLRAATVNIVCTTPGSGSPASGTGVIIDPRGVILTNAHVGQYLLLAETNKVAISCTIRTGSPASDAYRAHILYISPRWVNDHAKDITEEAAKGTGEHDYALLRITDSATLEALPETFPYVPVSTSEVTHATGQEVLEASYPAGFLTGASALYNMQLVSTVATIQELFTFTEAHTADLLSLGGIITAQQGSSGGGVIDGLGRLLAIIVTSSQADTTAGRDLRAVTLFHINQSIGQETGKSLREYLAGDLAATQRAFDTDTAPGLQEKILEALSLE